MPTSTPRRIPVLLGVLFGIAGMGSSSATIVLPGLAADLGVSVGVAAWSISLYVLTLAITTALYGRVADLVGIRTPLLVGLSLMVGGALVAAVAPTFPVLLAARLFQGAGAAAIPTLGMAILTLRYDGALRGLALARLAGTAAAITCLGPLAGGLVTNLLGWRAVMAIPVLSTVVLPFLWRDLTRGGTGDRLDVLGAALVALTAGGGVLLVQSPTTGVLVAVVGGLLIVLGIPAVAAWVRRRPDGFLPETVIRNPTVVRGAAAAAAVPAAWFGSLVGVPVVLVHAGWETWQVGVLLVPSAVIALILPRFVAPVHVRIGVPLTLVVSGVLAAVALVMAALGTSWVSAPVLVFSMALVAVAFGFGQPTLGAAVGAAVPSDVRGVALGIATLVFLVGGSVGSAAVAGLGDLFGIPASLALLALLPLAGVPLLRPLVREDRVARELVDH
ncbi:MFS transporter [Nocardioides bigeumensis]|uniref:Tetracycline resistance protein n=1 Tax=Nocardioides bigeumensis TaxID=433657 RepID=A0ABP5JT32_9ACTN